MLRLIIKAAAFVSSVASFNGYNIQRKDTILRSEMKTNKKPPQLFTGALKIYRFRSAADLIIEKLPSDVVVKNKDH
jgi:hypothetical protein